MSVSIQLPGLDCGLCGVATCTEFQEHLTSAPDLIKRCIHLDTEARVSTQLRVVDSPPSCSTSGCGPTLAVQQPRAFVDSLGREFDFVLQHFSEEPGPREIIIPHNPMLTREMHIQKGDVMIGRPLGMSCGCPVTHCGEVTDVDARTGVITWCVTGPLRPRVHRRGL